LLVVWIIMYISKYILYFVFTSFIIHGTGTALLDDNGRALVTTAPLYFILSFTPKGM
jgi:hypothetical protein